MLPFIVYLLCAISNTLSQVIFRAGSRWVLLLSSDR